MTLKNKQGQINSQRRQLLRSTLQQASAWAALSLMSSKAAALTPEQRASNKAKTAALAFPKPEKRIITIAATNLAALPYLPLLVAQQNGYFAQHGLELDINEQQSTARALQAVSAGGADIVCGWLENMLGAQSRALSLQSFVLLGLTPMMALGVPSKSTGAPLTTLAQLRGRKVGVVSLNSPTHTVALALLRRAGLRTSEIGFVSVGSPTGALAALRSGQIDALMYTDPLMLQLEQRAEIQVLADLRNPLAAHAALGMHLPSSCLAAPADFLQRFPGTAQACSDAMLQALQWLQQASLRDVLRLLPERVESGASSMDAQLFVASFERLREAFSPDGQCAQPAVQNLLQAMHDADPALRLEKIDPLRSINNAWAQRSLLRLRG